MAWLNIVSIQALGGVLEKLLLFEGSNLIRINKLLLPGVWSILVESLLFFSSGQFSTNLPCKDVITQSCPSLIPRWLQGEWFRAMIGTKWRQRC
jgi:hypothetical protein